jgi:hypothetical protein
VLVDLNYIFVFIFLYTRIRIMSRVLVTATGFGLVLEFTNHSQVVTAINYNTAMIFTLQSTPI